MRNKENLSMWPNFRLTSVLAHVLYSQSCRGCHLQNECQ